MRTLQITVLCTFFLLLFSSNGLAQDQDFTRKGSFLVEAGYFLVPGITSGTGAFILIDEGNALTNIAFDGGYFVSNDFAVKFGFGLLSSGDAITSFSGGIKYYIDGSIPVELMGGLISFDGESEFVGNVSVGYGIRLAPNINLEPSIGGVYSGAEFSTRIGLRFAMFL